MGIKNKVHILNGQMKGLLIYHYLFHIHLPCVKINRLLSDINSIDEL
jgi:hypothetical protein